MQNSYSLFNAPCGGGGGGGREGTYSVYRTAIPCLIPHVVVEGVGEGLLCVQNGYTLFNTPCGGDGGGGGGRGGLTVCAEQLFPV